MSLWCRLADGSLDSLTRTMAASCCADALEFEAFLFLLLCSLCFFHSFHSTRINTTRTKSNYKNETSNLRWQAAASTKYNSLAGSARIGSFDGPQCHAVCPPSSRLERHLCAGLLLLLIFGGGGRPLTTQQAAQYNSIMNSIDLQAEYAASDDYWRARQAYQATKGWFWSCDPLCQRNHARMKSAERALQEIRAEGAARTSMPSPLRGVLDSRHGRSPRFLLATLSIPASALPSVKACGMPCYEHSQHVPGTR